MKLNEYFPLYNQFIYHEYNLTIQGREASVNEHYVNNPDIEIEDIHVEFLDSFDYFSLISRLRERDLDSKSTILLFRELFDNYRVLGGDPLYWLYTTYESINLNPQNISVEIRTDLEKSLIELIEVYQKAPFDSMYSFGKKTDDLPTDDFKPLNLRINNDEKSNLLFDVLKSYFNSRENDLKDLLDGGFIEKPLIFPHNQNKLVELFRRMKYNGYINENSTELKNWLCKNFLYRFRRGDIDQIKPLNPSSVYDILSKGKGLPSKKERILIDWLEYKTQDQLQNNQHE